MTVKDFDLPYLTTVSTAIATFLMGFIDSYTYIQFDGAFASAQTGNLVLLGSKLFSAQWTEMLSHIWVFSGFALGTFAGEAVIEKSKHRGQEKYRIYLLLRIVLLLLLALFQAVFNSAIMLFILGALAGYELTMFRKFRGTAVTNGIMTGNTKNMMNKLYKFLFKGDKKARMDFSNLAWIVIIFLLGAGTGTLVTQYNQALNLWIAFGIALMTFLWTSRELAK